METDQQSLRPELPDDLEAIDSLLQMARAFAPNFELHSSAENAPKADNSGSEERIRQVEARYRTLVEQIPAVTFMASFE
ncbi:MAG: hypothetical protein ACREP1_00775, partial [Rhodanobacteraceae bacterium]